MIGSPPHFAHQHDSSNTTVSTSWGFPQTCPEGCACDCFDCNKPGEWFE
jgi:hypothetical protein